MTGKTTVNINGIVHKIKFGNYTVMKLQETIADKFGSIDTTSLSPTQMIKFACVLVLLGLENQAILDETENEVAWSEIIEWADDATINEITDVVTVFSESKAVGSLAQSIEANLPKDKTAKKKSIQ